MPALSPDDRLQFQRAWTLTRLLAWALCFGAPLVYALVFAMTVLKGPLDQALRLGMPWHHPAVLGTAFLSVGTLGAAFLLNPLFLNQLRREPTLARAVALSRQATVVSCALLESVAIFGLVAGMLAGPGAAPLALLLFLVPPAGYLILVPGPQAWLAVLEAGHRG
jgi:hypothetical protein